MLTVEQAHAALLALESGNEQERAQFASGRAAAERMGLTECEYWMWQAGADVLFQDLPAPQDQANGSPSTS